MKIDPGYLQFEARYCQVLRSLRERYGYTANTLGIAAGIPGRTVEKHLSGEQPPSRKHDHAYKALFGAELVVPIYAAMGIDLSGHDRDRPAPECAELLALISETTATFARCMADGRIDHLERPQLERALDQLTREASAWRARGGERNTSRKRKA